MVALAGSLLVMESVLASSTVIIKDGDFLPASWSHEVRFDSGFDTVNTTITQVSTGGSPGSYRMIGYAMDHNGTQLYGSVFILNIFEADSYTPSTQGAVNLINYFEQQTRTGANWSPALVAGQPIISQGGKIFIGPVFNFGPNDHSWTTYMDDLLAASDFVELNGMNVITSSNPDFSSSGSTMKFGYARSNSYSFDSSISHAIDNWSFSLSVTPIPEPSSFVISAGFLGLALIRRTR